MLRSRVVGVGLSVLTVCACGAPPRRGVPDGPHAPAWPSDRLGVPELDVRYPMPDWPTGTPESVGLDPVMLDAAGDYAESIGSECLLVIRHGVLVYERHFGDSTPETHHRTWSIAKSFTSALTDIALTRGEIGSLDDPAALYLPAWAGTDKADIRIRDVLSMDTGLEYNFIQDNTWVVFQNDQTSEALGYPTQAQPGTVWHYSNHSAQLMHPILQAATGLDPEAYAEQVLWGPLGFDLDGPPEDRTQWERDESGNPTMYKNVYATCGDLARLGYLYLHGGVWQGKTIIAPEYLQAAIQPSQDMNRVYGHLWWVNGDEPGIDPTDDPIVGTLFPGAPDDMFSALGLGQNFIDVIPSSDTIYVHVHKAPHDPLTNFITDPAGTIDALLQDGKMTEHKALLDLLLGA